MQHLLLMYDITDDRIRAKIATTCEDYGLDRVQYSAFYGKLNRNHQEELFLRLQHLLGRGEGRIQLIPISQNDWERRLEINAYDR